MTPDVQALFDLVERQRTELETRVSSLDSFQVDRKPAPSAWSVRQIVEHLVLSDEIFGQASEPKSEPPPLRVLPRAFRRWMVRAAFRRDLTLPLPSPEVEPRGDAALPELLARWAAARESMRASLENPEARYAHPILGPLTAVQMLELDGDHVAYHARQIERAAGEPSSG